MTQFMMDHILQNNDTSSRITSATCSETRIILDMLDMKASALEKACLT